MTDTDPSPEDLGEAAERVRHDPALGADSPDPDDDNQGIDDDATTPDGAVSDQE